MGWGLSKKAGRNGKAKGSEATPLACSLPLISALEPRMMFDGAVAATVADTAASAPTAASTADASHDTGARDSNQAGSADNSQGTQDLQASPVSDALTSRQVSAVGPTESRTDALNSTAISAGSMDA